MNQDPKQQQKLEQMRREYTRGGLRRDDLTGDPLAQFQRWFDEAVAAELGDPTAMVLATVAESGQPSQRIVLLKRLDERGFVFYSNRASRKGGELAHSGLASLLFPWHPLDRQVKVAGRVEVLGQDDAEAYFASRPRESQLAALASQQSEVIESRAALMADFEALTARYANRPIPLPQHWGGYRIVPTEVEFWQGGAHRLHDSFRYSQQDSGEWRIDRLAP
ncbi:pyridoxamine 5'-phosphate oxidase [Gilvimarinus polysaccharolyticus]|uniref:pyridoxamine 5'-phosphate oxidase n=1 Tax=Gilvimarinus polysaccharolyticus TaxID=863921 RepID=UPI0006732173|nr:pyridoxamine 5'-phosphate oxidase [Gilvimarinus polysaccharolyticus]